VLVGVLVVLGVALLLGQRTAGGAGSKGIAASKSSAASKKSAAGWRLVYHESFGGRPGPLGENTPWVLDTYGPDSSYQQRLAPINDIPFSDNGQFWTQWGGQGFLNQLNTFRTYRKSFTFGSSGWLTAELNARANTNGVLLAPPSLTVQTVPGAGRVGFIEEPIADNGILIRTTDPLPPEYRIEYTQKTMNFGGTRNGEWNYDGLVNGYLGPKAPLGCETAGPWIQNRMSSYFEPSPGQLRPYCAFPDVPSSSNGFYNIAIADYPVAAYNNTLNHNTMKVRMDTYNAPGGGFRVCNPETDQFYPDTTGNAFFMSFISVPQVGGGGSGFFYPPSMTPTECGVNFGATGVIGQALEQAQIVPEDMPRHSYTFAVERDASGYTLEVSGCFRYGGCRTFRHHRDFIQDGRPIWHYNNTPDQYDGQFDNSWTYPGPLGSFTVDHTWPAGSAYPDYLVIGDPHANYYAGTASIDDIRLYVPKSDKGKEKEKDKQKDKDK
jgi:hypothetical protein